MFFWLEPKEPKVQARPDAPPAGQANAHEEFKPLQKHFIIELIVGADAACLYVNSKGAVFFVYKLQGSHHTIEDEKEGASKFFRIRREALLF